MKVECPAGSHAGAAGHHWFGDLPIAQAVPGARHPESSGTRRHLPPPRSPGRPLSAEGGPRLPLSRGRATDLRPGRLRSARPSKLWCVPEELLAARELVREVYMDEEVERHVVQLVNATRRPENQGLGHLKPLIGFGASPAPPSDWPWPAKCRLHVRTRSYVIQRTSECRDERVAPQAGLTFEAEAEDISQEQIVTEILDQVQVP